MNSVSQEVIGFFGLTEIERMPATEARELLARLALQEHTRHTTAINMADRVADSLTNGQIPEDRPLLRATRNKHSGKLEVLLDDPFNSALLSRLGVNCIEDLSDYQTAYLNDIVVSLVPIVKIDDLTETERDLESVPFPAIRMEFSGREY